MFMIFGEKSDVIWCAVISVKVYGCWAFAHISSEGEFTFYKKAKIIYNLVIQGRAD